MTPAGSVINLSRRIKKCNERSLCAPEGFVCSLPLIASKIEVKGGKGGGGENFLGGVLPWHLYL